MVKSKKKLSTTMLLSYLLMNIGLFLWNSGTILFLSIFTLGLPLIVLAIPVLGMTMPRAKSSVSLFLRFFCSLLSLIPLCITITSLPLKRMVSEAGGYTAAPHASIIAILIIISGIIFLLTSICVFIVQRQDLQKNNYLN
jgi:hypothetical protein